METHPWQKANGSHLTSKTLGYELTQKQKENKTSKQKAKARVKKDYMM